MKEKKKKILIIDDDHKFRKTLSDILLLEGYAPSTVASGKTALEKIKRDASVLVLLDLKLMDMDGLKVLKEIKKISPDTECLVITESASNKSVIKAANLGVYGFIQKSYDVQQILLFIRRAVEKIETREALHESEERYRSLVESTKDLIYVVDRDCRYLFMSGESLVRLNLSKDEVVGKKYRNFHSKMASEIFAEKINQVIRTNKSIRHEHASQRDEKHFLRTYTPLLGNDGKPYAVNVISKEITELKQLEEKLRKEKEHAQGLIETAQTIVLNLDTKGRIVYFNPYMENLSGYRLEEVKGKDWFSTFLTSHERDRIWKLFLKAISDISTQGNINLIVTKNGDKRKIEWHDKTLKDSKGNIIGLLSVGQDVTERIKAEEVLRRSEERFRLAVSHLGILSAQTDCDLRYTWIYNFHPEFNPKSVIGKRDVEIEDNEGTKQLMQMKQQVIDTEERQRMEIVFPLSDGERTYDVFAEPLRDSGGQIIGVATSSLDITERKKAEEELQSRYKVESLISRMSADFVNMSPEDIDSSINRMLKNIANIAGAVRSSVFLVSDDLTTITNTHEWCADLADSQIQKLQGIPFETFGYYRELLIRHKNVIVNSLEDLSSDKAQGEIEWIKKHGFRSLIFSPLILKGKLYGTLGFYGPVNEKYFWNEEFVFLLKFVANILVNALERKKAEDAMRISEDKYRQLFENASDAVMIFDSETLRFEDANEAALELLGYTREEFFALSVEDISAEKEKTKETVRKIKIDDPEVRRIPERKFIKKNGTIFLGEVSTGSFISSGRRKIIGAVRNITDRKRAEEKLIQSKRELQQLTSHMQTATERERALVASELHDEVGQALTGLKMDIYLTKNKLSKGKIEIPGEFKKMEKLLDDSIQKLRKIYSDLRPSLLEHFGIGEAMKQFVKDFQEQSGTKCTFYQDPEEILLDENRSIALYRILQGAINNIKWHSQATKVDIRMVEKGPNLKLTIKDNGKGITEEQSKRSGSFGLIGMRERARYLGGELKIKGIPDKGTTIKLEIPKQKSH